MCVYVPLYPFICSRPIIIFFHAAPGVSKCYPNPCLFDGECVEKDGSYFCKCKKHFTGTHCQSRRNCLIYARKQLLVYHTGGFLRAKRCFHQRDLIIFTVICSKWELLRQEKSRCAWTIWAVEIHLKGHWQWKFNSFKGTCKTNNKAFYRFLISSFNSFIN